MIRVESVYPSGPSAYFQKKQYPKPKNDSKFNLFQEVLEKEIEKRKQEQ